jgi:hypothetical protein
MVRQLGNMREHSWGGKTTGRLCAQVFIDEQYFLCSPCRDVISGTVQSVELSCLVSHWISQSQRTAEAQSL